MTEIISESASVPVAQSGPRKRWLSGRRLVAVAATPVVLGLAAGLAVGLSGSGAPASAVSILTGDGYPVTMTLNHQQLAEIVAAGGGSTADTNLGMAVVDSGVMGMKGGSDEFVLRLTPEGKTIFALPSARAAMATGAGKGISIRLAGNGDYLVMYGPDAAFGN